MCLSLAVFQAPLIRFGGQGNLAARHAHDILALVVAKLDRVSRSMLDFAGLMAAVPDLPSLVAVIVATPLLTPVTVSVALVDVPLATLGFDDVHANVLPVSTAPEASSAVAVKTCVAPMAIVVDPAAWHDE